MNDADLLNLVIMLAGCSTYLLLGLWLGYREGAEDQRRALAEEMGLDTEATP